MTLPFSSLLVAALVSLGASGWEVLKFEGVAANRTSFDGSHISIAVNGSASPLIHIFPSAKSIRRIVVTGSVKGDLEWSDDADDALLRVGVIQSGEKRLNALQKMTAPEWLLQVDEWVGAKGGGVEKILCYHLSGDPDKVGRSRTNPEVSLFKETIQAAPDEDGNFKIVAEFSDPITSPGLWILADGDDSGSTFEVRIDSIDITE